MKSHKLNTYAALRGFYSRDSELYVGDVPLSQILEQFGTPLYVYNGDIIKEAYHAVREALPQFEVFYALKANPSLALCSLLRALGAGAELASGGELQLALRAGFAPEKLIFAGPAKTNDELALAVRTGIASLNVESFDELARLEAVVRQEHKAIQASLRINTWQEDIVTPEVMVGTSSRFGIDSELVLDNVERLQDLDYVDLGGIHVYTASQILDVDGIIRNLTRTLDFAVQLSQRAGVRIRRIVFGGGFGVPYAADECGLDMQRLGDKVQATLTAYTETLPLNKMRLIVELGRYLVARAGVFLTRVVDVKTSRGQTYVATDGGMNHFFRPVLMNLNHPTFIVNRLDQPETQTVNIGGPLCTPIDTIAKDVSIPQAQMGDVVGFFNAGAYGFSMSLLEFLVHPRPAEVLILDGEPQLIRGRSTFEDTLRYQHVPKALSES